MHGYKKSSGRKRIASILILFLIILFVIVIVNYLSLVKQPSTSNSQTIKLSSDIKPDQVLKIENSKPVVENKKTDTVAVVDDTVTTVVECMTSKGSLIFDIRSGWAPLGAQLFIDLVEKGHFTDLPFSRVCPRYITQFGVKNKDSPGRVNSLKSIPDDPPLWGVRDMDFGYLFFAGSGKDSRAQDMVIALCEKPGCIASQLGKALWEVPIGTTRAEGFSVLEEIAKTGFPYPKLEMQGLHKNAGGPDYDKIVHDSMYLKREYPYMEYFQSCKILERNIQHIRDLSIDKHIISKDSKNMNKLEVESMLKNQIPSEPFLVKMIISHSDESLQQTKTTSSSSSSSVVVLEVVSSYSSHSRFLSSQSYITTNNNHNTHHHHYTAIHYNHYPLSPLAFVRQIRPDWAPLGSQRMKELVEAKYFDEVRFFRVLPKFVAQFGISGTPTAAKQWPSIKDDLVKESNIRGTITFATSGRNTRSTQLFINYGDNRFLDKEGFSPIGRVIQGMEVIDSIYSGYREKPNQGMIQRQGNEYLIREFPLLSFISNATIVNHI